MVNFYVKSIAPTRDFIWMIIGNIYNRYVSLDYLTS